MIFQCSGGNGRARQYFAQHGTFLCHIELIFTLHAAFLRPTRSWQAQFRILFFAPPTFSPRALNFPSPLPLRQGGTTATAGRSSRSTRAAQPSCTRSSLRRRCRRHSKQATCLQLPSQGCGSGLPRIPRRAPPSTARLRVHQRPAPQALTHTRAAAQTRNPHLTLQLPPHTHAPPPPSLPSTLQHAPNSPTAPPKKDSWGTQDKSFWAMADSPKGGLPQADGSPAPSPVGPPGSAAQGSAPAAAAAGAEEPEMPKEPTGAPGSFFSQFKFSSRLRFDLAPSPRKKNGACIHL